MMKMKALPQLKSNPACTLFVDPDEPNSEAHPYSLDEEPVDGCNHKRQGA